MLNKTSRILLWIAALLLVVSIFVPIWRIELDAPQYPEGLVMQIYSYKLGGQVEIINGLNHYIGMATLHSENFIEFTLLPYIIGAFAICIAIAGVIGRKKFFYITFWSFLFFGIIAMIDFWRWEYNYGHHLDPNAAIIVPGMSYQPPLIGFKQLLNFGAYSIPDLGGWLFITSGILMLIILFIESKFFPKKMNRIPAVLLIVFSCFTACSSNKSETIKLHSDGCDYCQMKISDGRFGAEIITQKGRVYKFDDLQCLLNYASSSKSAIAAYYVHDFSKPNTLIDATSAYYVKNEGLKSPMGGNTAAFKEELAATQFANSHAAKMQLWKAICKE